MRAINPTDTKREFYRKTDQIARKKCPKYLPNYWQSVPATEGFLALSSEFLSRLKASPCPAKPSPAQPVQAEKRLKVTHAVSQKLLHCFTLGTH